MPVDSDTEAKFPLPDNQTADNAVSTLQLLEQEHANGDTRPFFLAVGFRESPCLLIRPALSSNNHATCLHF